MACTGPLLVDVELGSGHASHVAWCPVSGLLAVAISHHGARPTRFVLLEPHAPNEIIPLPPPAPAAAPPGHLLSLAWSPPGCRRMLLAATSGGGLTVWTQLPPLPAVRSASAPPRPTTLCRWWASPLLPAPGGAGLVAARWLRCPSPWSWSSETVAAADFRQETVTSMFHVERPAAGAAHFGWVRPNVPALAVVGAGGEVLLSWGALCTNQEPGWAAGAPLQLPGAHEPDGGGGGGGGPAVLVADAIADGASGVHVAYTLAASPDTVHVALIRGDPAAPRAAGCAADPSGWSYMAVSCVARLTPQPGAAVRALAWEPRDAGTRLACVVAACGAGAGGRRAVVMLQLGGEDGGSSCVARCELPVGGGGGDADGDVSGSGGGSQPVLEWSSDVQLLAAGGGDGGLLLLDALSLSPAPWSLRAARGVSVGAAGSAGWDDGGGGGREWAAPRQAAMVSAAFSPNDVCFAALHAAPDTCGARLLLWCLTALPGRGCGELEVRKLAAARLAWAMAGGLSHWDAVEHALQQQQALVQQQQQQRQRQHPHPQPGEEQQQEQQQQQQQLVDAGVAGVMALVDSLVHGQPGYTRPVFCAAWDRSKLALASRVGGCPEAGVLALELRLRLLVNGVLSGVMHTLELLVTEAAQRLKDNRDAKFSSADVAAARHWSAYLTQLLVFLLSAFKAWLTQRQRGDGSGGGLVPGVRLLLDTYTHRTYNTGHVALAGVATLAKTQLDGYGGISLDEAYAAYNQLVLVQLGQDGAQARQQRHIEFVDSANTAAVAFGGAGQFRLHYCRVTPSVDPCSLSLEAMEAAVPLLQRLPLMTDVELHAAAERLGLFPPLSPAASALYRSELQLHHAFRREPPFEQLEKQHAATTTYEPLGSGRPSSRTEQLPTAKRRRKWLKERNASLGQAGGPSQFAPMSSLDLLTGQQLGTQDDLLLAVDGSVVTADVGRRVNPGTRVGPVVQQQRTAWLCACPLTGSGWKEVM